MFSIWEGQQASLSLTGHSLQFPIRSGIIALLYISLTLQWCSYNLTEAPTNMAQDCGCPVSSIQSPSTCPYLTYCNFHRHHCRENLSSCTKVQVIQGNYPRQCWETVVIKGHPFWSSHRVVIDTLSYAYLWFLSLIDFPETSKICFTCFWIYWLSNSENLNSIIFVISLFVIFFLCFKGFILCLCVHVWIFVCVCVCQQRPNRMLDSHPPNYKYRQLWVT